MRRPLLPLVAVLVCVALPVSAFAYNLLTRGGNPIRFHGDPGNGGISTVVWYMDPVTEEGSVPPGTTQQAMQRALDEWQNVACSSIEFAYGGLGQASERGWVDDGVTMSTFEDPFNDLSGGVLAATVTWDQDVIQQNNGMNFRDITNMDVVFGDGINFILNQEIANGCNSQYNLEQIALHEYGHGIGYAHSCEQGEACGDPAFIQAVMYWAANACDSVKFTPQQDDLEAHTLVYGPNNLTSFTPSVERGGTPLVVDFLLSTFADATNLAAVWNFGDGGDSTEINPSHTYDEEGSYGVQVVLSGNSATCGGDFTHNIYQTDLITACNLPETSFNYEAEELDVTFMGASSSTAGLGCIDSWNWDFGDNSEPGTTRNTFHSYKKAGTYTVAFSATGIAGTGPDFTRDITVKEKGCNCSLGAPSRPSFSAALLACLALLAGLWVRKSHFRA